MRGGFVPGAEAQHRTEFEPEFPPLAKYGVRGSLCFPKTAVGLDKLELNGFSQGRREINELKGCSAFNLDFQKRHGLKLLLYQCFRLGEDPGNGKTRSKVLFAFNQRAVLENGAVQGIPFYEPTYPIAGKAFAEGGNELAAGVTAARGISGARRGRIRWINTIKVLVIALIRKNRPRRQTEVPAGVSAYVAHIQI